MNGRQQKVLLPKAERGLFRHGRDEDFGEHEGWIFIQQYPAETLSEKPEQFRQVDV